MQGLGKPGVHQAQIAYTGMPKNVITGGADHMGHVREPHRDSGRRAAAQAAPRHADGLGQADDPQDPHRGRHQERPPVDFWGTGGHEEPTSNQYKKYTYPIPKEEGGTEIHMMWTDYPVPHHLLERRQRRR